MDGATILKPTGCDLTRLPLGALEAFVLSQLDGHLCLEEVAVVCSLELGETTRIRTRLVDLGGACRGEPTRAEPRGKRRRRAAPVAIEENTRAAADPRSEQPSDRPSPVVEKEVRRTPQPERRRSSRKLPRAQRTSSRRIQAAKKSSTRPPQSPPRPPPDPEKLRKLQTAAKEIEVQARVGPLLAAAEEALRANDVINAANNFRLALQYREDPFVRLKLEDADKLARALRLDRSLTCARAAEEEKRWADAAMHLARAHEIKATAEIADRAANALRLAQGDLERAAALAEQAVSLDPKNARYRMTLGEVYLAAKLLTRAATSSATALELAPKDPRAQELAAAIARASKERP